MKNPQQLPGAFIRGIKADIVAIQAMTSNLNNAIHLTKKTKALFPSTLVVMGGIAPSQRQTELLENNSSVDVVVSSEGEITFNEIVYEYGLNGRKHFGLIKGIAFRDEGRKNNTNTSERKNSQS